MCGWKEWPGECLQDMHLRAGNWKPPEGQELITAMILAMSWTTSSFSQAPWRYKAQLLIPHMRKVAKLTCVSLWSKAELRCNHSTVQLPCLVSMTSAEPVSIRAASQKPLHLNNHSFLSWHLHITHFFFSFLRVGKSFLSIHSHKGPQTPE